MTRRVVIDRSCLPVRIPVTGWIAIWLLMQHLSAPDWAYGVFWTLAAILGIGGVVMAFRTDAKKIDGFGD